MLSVPCLRLRPDLSLVSCGNSGLHIHNAFAMRSRPFDSESSLRALTTSVWEVHLETNHSTLRIHRPRHQFWAMVVACVCSRMCLPFCLERIGQECILYDADLCKYAHMCAVELVNDVIL